LCDRYKRVLSKYTKIIGIQRLVVEIEAAQVSASEHAKFDRFTRFQTFAQTAITHANTQFFYGIYCYILST